MQALSHPGYGVVPGDPSPCPTSEKSNFFCLGLAPAQANTPLPTSLHTAGEDSPWSRFGEASPTQNESQASRLSLGQKLTQGPGGSPPPPAQRR